MASERRQKQVARLIQERLATLFLQELKDPRASFITVTGVDVNPDLTLAKVRYSVLGGNSERSKIKSLLQHAHGYLRTEVAQAVQLRSAPQLSFEYDEGVERAERIHQILRKVLPDEGSESDGPTEPRLDLPPDE